MRCSICKFPVEATDQTLECGSCAQTYHRVCWERIGGCASFGCSSAPALEHKAPVPSAHVGWGDEKTCPGCGREIQSSVLMCRSCSAEFPYADPMTPEEYERWKSQEEARRRLRKILLVLGAASICIVPGPVVSPLAGYLTWRNRRDFVGEYSGYIALGYGVATVGGCSGIIMALLALGW